MQRAERIVLAAAAGDDPKPNLPDEYQDGASAGSLVKSRRHWLHLLDADVLPVPQQFTFAFGCPSRRMARGLANFLRYTRDASLVRAVDRAPVPVDDGWSVTGSTNALIWCLPSLEHLGMRLRRAGARYESTLVTLDLLPTLP